MMAEDGRTGGLNLEDLTEFDAASLLGVHVTTLRRWHKYNALPQHGERGARRYKWAEVRDWHLLYRVRTANAGGAQEGILASEVAEIRKAAEARGVSVATVACEARMRGVQERHRKAMQALSAKIREAQPVSSRWLRRRESVR